jgi:TPP-dependent pyruvate/acetoin dehydrogenase alpha subunit
VADLADKAKGYGIPAVTVDGNDVLAVYEATKSAVDRARQGRGTHFIEVKTYRRSGHAEHDGQEYVPKAELARWREQDPVERYTRRLHETGWAAPSDFEVIDERVRVEVDAATDACLDDPLPSADTALSGVYAQPPEAEHLWFRSR